MQALLDERTALLETLAALELAKTTFTTKARDRVLDNPAAHDAVEDTIRKGHAKFDQGAEVVRHRLLLDDSLLSTRGVRPWEDRDS